MVHIDDLEFTADGQHYYVRQIDQMDDARLREYQQLRADIFVNQLDWKLPVDSDGREYDHYDRRPDFVSVHCVYGRQGAHSEHLLGGGRIFQLREWLDSMIFNEFYQAQMVSAEALLMLRDQYDCQDLLEFNRICVRRGRWYTPPDALEIKFNLAIVSDLLYAAVFAMAEKTGRRSVLGIVDTLYLGAIKRSHFVYREIYGHNLNARGGHAIIVVDLSATIRALYATNNHARAERLLVQCTNKNWGNSY